LLGQLVIGTFQLKLADTKSFRILPVQDLLDCGVELDLAARRVFVLNLPPLVPSPILLLYDALPLCQVATDQVGALIVADEIKNTHAILAGGQPQPAAELLSEYGLRLSGAQEEEHADIRKIDTLIEQVHGERHCDLVHAKIGDKSVAISSLRMNRRRRNPVLQKVG